MPGDVLSGPPPSPGTGGIGTGGPTPSFKGLSGGQQPPQNGQQQPAQPNTPGQAQIGGATVRMALEIDQALKTLAQSVPALGPWVEKTVGELRQQIGNALNGGGVATSAAPAGAKSMPDGGQNL